MTEIMTVTLRDSMNRNKFKHFEIAEQPDLAGYDQLSTQITNVLGPVTVLSVPRVTVRLQMADTIAGGGTTNVDVGATFTCRIGDTHGKMASLKVPGFDQAFADAAGKIRMNEPEVVAFLALFLLGGPCYLSDGQQAYVWIQGRMDK